MVKKSEFTKFQAYHATHMHFEVRVRCGFTLALFLSDFTIDFVPCILCRSMLAIPNEL